MKTEFCTFLVEVSLSDAYILNIADSLSEPKYALQMQIFADIATIATISSIM